MIGLWEPKFEFFTLKISCFRDLSELIYFYFPYGDDP